MRSLVIIAAVMITCWLVFVVSLVVAQRKVVSTNGWRDAARIVPDALRLVRRLAVDGNISRLTRLPIWLLLAYLVFPIDIVPDFIPVIGYLDDVILMSVVLRGVTRRVGADKIDEHWPGTTEGLIALGAALRLP